MKIRQQLQKKLKQLEVPFLRQLYLMPIIIGDSPSHHPALTHGKIRSCQKWIVYILNSCAEA